MKVNVNCEVQMWNWWFRSSAFGFSWWVEKVSPPFSVSFFLSFSLSWKGWLFGFLYTQDVRRYRFSFVTDRSVLPKLCTSFPSFHPCIFCPSIHPSIHPSFLLPTTLPPSHLKTPLPLPVSSLPTTPNRIPLPVPPRLPLPHHAHRPPLHHQTHHLEQRVRRRHGRVLRVGVVRRRHLDNVRRNEVDAFEAADDGPQFARCPAACFGRAGCGGDCENNIYVSWERR